MSCDSCTEKGIPVHLCSFGKNENVPFIENELIFRRVSKKIVTEFDDLNIVQLQSVFPLKNDSYNRSTLSKKEDVLIDDLGETYPEDNIISLDINAINSISNNVLDNAKNSRIFSLRVEYKPLQCNYAHSEISCYLDGVKIEPGGNPKTSKLYMRHQLKRLLKLA